MDEYHKMIVRVTAILFISDILFSCQASVEFTFCPKTRKANIKYCCIPKSPVRFLYKHRENDITHYNSKIQPNNVLMTKTQSIFAPRNTQLKSIENTQNFKFRRTQLEDVMRNTQCNYRSWEPLSNVRMDSSIPREFGSDNDVNLFYYTF